MKATSASEGVVLAEAARGGWLARALRALVLARLRDLAQGEITLVEDGERRVFGSATADFPVRATVTVLQPSLWRQVVLGGSVGAGEAFSLGAWSCDDLTALVRILVRNRQALETLDGGLSRLVGFVDRLRHRLRRNTRAGSRVNIAAHYDLGNDFYALFLDPTMTYSCAFFEDDAADLERASLAKLERVCRKLDLGPQDHLLEIGSGWASLAVHAAKRYGCRVTTTTISKAQHAYATERVAQAGLAGRVRVLLEDYRDLRGRYDKLASIEMIEAVGHEHYDTYFRRCSELLAPQGAMLLQAIVIGDRFYEASLRSVDFIQRHIFPGSCIPSVSALTAAMARATDLRLVHLEDMSEHYARTLRAWRQRFLARLGDVHALGFSESFARLWEYYFCYCEGGFLERSIGDVQMVFAKPLRRTDAVRA